MKTCRCGWQLPALRVGLEATIGAVEPLGLLVTLTCPVCAAHHFETLRQVDGAGRFVLCAGAEHSRDGACGVNTHGTICLFLRGHSGPHMFKATTTTTGGNDGNDDEKKSGG